MDGDARAVFVAVDSSLQTNSATLGYSGDKTYTYDLNGNLVSDGILTNTWNYENRLSSVEPISPSNGNKKLEFDYDYQGRRNSKIVSIYTNAAWASIETNVFVYDGWNLVKEIQSNASTNYYVWGKDLSGSLQGAGGVGGLLVSDVSNSDSFFLYDANGNVVNLVDDSGTNIVATYEYDPFGNLVAQTESVDNVFKFSTKFQDTETDWYYYGYRYYNPQQGRWLNRDPIEEDGGANIYLLVENDSVNNIDIYGLAKSKCPEPGDNVWHFDKNAKPREIDANTFEFKSDTGSKHVVVGVVSFNHKLHLECCGSKGEAGLVSDLFEYAIATGKDLGVYRVKIKDGENKHWTNHRVFFDSIQPRLAIFRRTFSSNEACKTAKKDYQRKYDNALKLMESKNNLLDATEHKDISERIAKKLKVRSATY